MVIDAIRTQAIGQVWGCLDDDVSRHGHLLEGVLVKGGMDILRHHCCPVDQVVVAIGCNADRVRLAEDIHQWGYEMVTIIHQTATVARDVEIGPGTVIMAGGIIQPGSRIGSLVVINTAATVDHDCVVEDGAHLAPGVHLGGNVHVGREALLGIGTMALPGTRIGDHSVVGAGSVIVRDIPARVVAFGVPARVRRVVVP